MRIGSRWIGAGLVVLALCGVAAAQAQRAGGGAHQPGNDGGRPRLQRLLERRPMLRRMHERRAQARGELRRGLEALGITDAQRALALQQALAAEPIVREARKEAARILMQAHGAPRTGDAGAPERGEVREKMKALRERTFRQTEPLARAVAASLSAEQREKIEAGAAKHGRTFDEERLVRRIAFALTRPMTAPRLEVKLGR